MGLNSPVISDQDSLIEEAPLQYGDQKKRGNPVYSTFTRKRPEDLPDNLKKKKRQSLMSPQSIPNLDSDGLITPDFTMTQSMYEPTEKRKQQEKLEANSKLLNLIASEKSAQAAKERKQKEINKRLNDNRKRNEEKQRLAEERRLRIIADQDAKMQRILNKISSPGPMTASCYGNTNKSVIRFKNSMGSGFLDKRPISSTGKIFGFGSSAPREVCEKLTLKRLKKKGFASQEVPKPDTPVSRMCASQIVSHFTYETESKSKRQSKSTKGNVEKPISFSTLNISNSSRNLAKNNEVQSNSKVHNGRSKTKPKSTGITDTTKSSVSNSNLREVPNSLKKPQIILTVPKRRERSAETNKYNSNLQHNPEPRSRTLERKQTPVEQVSTDNHTKKQIKSEKRKPTKPKSEQLSSLKKANGVENVRKNPTICAPAIEDVESSRKPEVRFEESENYKDEDVSILSQPSISIERHRGSTSNLTEDEYKQRIALQRKLAKEKKRKEQEEKDRIASKERELLEDLAARNKSFEISESTDHEQESSSSLVSKTEITVDKEIKTDLRFNEIEDNAKPRIQTPNESISSVDLPKNEVPELNIEMTTSTEALDRRERRRRLDNIMSRIKKPIGGSSENVTHHLSTTTLQDMLDKGHLSGMSKTAAILMKNASHTSELYSSASELRSQSELNKSSPGADLSLKDSVTSEKADDTEQVRGSCDGQEDVAVKSELPQLIGTKSNLMDNLVVNANKPYLSSWQEKYSDSYSLDTEDDE